MTEVRLVDGGVAVVDHDVSALISGYRWRRDRYGYVMRKTAGKRVYLHHVVLPGPPPDPGMERDHVSRDKLDNRRENLRWLTRSQSAQNRGHQRRNVVGIRGVTYVPKGHEEKPYLAVAQSGGKRTRLGYFADAGVAAAAVRAWRLKHMPASHEGVGG